VIAKIKISLSVLALLFLCFHFLMVIALVNPVKKIEGKGYYYALFYVYPFFDQGWNLFAPAPRSNYHLYVKYTVDSKTVQYDLINHIQHQHAANRIGGYEVLSLAISNSIHSFEGSTTLKNKLNGPVKDDVTFTIVQHLANQYIMAQSQGKAKNSQLFLLVENVITKEQRVYF